MSGYIYIQNVSQLVDITVGGDFLGLYDQKSSYKHVSNFGWLQSHGHFLIPIHALVWTTSYETSWQVMCSTWWLIVCVASIFATRLAHLPTESPVFYLNTWKVFKECREGGVGGYSPGQCVLHDSATTTCSKTLITYITVTVLAPDVQNSTAIVL